MATQFKSVEGDRIERYIAEIFMNVGEADSAHTPDGFPVRTWSAAYPVLVGEPIEKGLRGAADALLEDLQRAFGAIPLPQKLWWREKPHFRCHGIKNGAMVQVWVRFGITGWTANQMLADALRRVSE